MGPLPKPLCYQNSLPEFLQGLTSMTTNLNQHNVYEQVKQHGRQEASKNCFKIMEDTILQNKDTIKNIIKSKFKEKTW